MQSDGANRWLSARHHSQQWVWPHTVRPMARRRDEFRREAADLRIRGPQEDYPKISAKFTYLSLVPRGVSSLRFDLAMSSHRVAAGRHAVYGKHANLRH